MKKESKKMNCKPYMDRIDEYVEGLLGREEKISFEDHLSGCPECSELVRLQRLADKIIAKEKSSSTDFYLTSRIMHRIEESTKETGSALIRILKPAMVTISVAAAIFAGVLIGNISAKPEVNAIPVELTMMNDIAMESVNVLSQE